MLKHVQYRTASPRYTGEVVYAILEGSRVVFSGIIKPGSTINFAERIITNISSQEGINPRRYQWYDLQTHLGYQGKEPGIFEFSRLVLGVQEEMEVPLNAIILWYEPGAIHAESWVKEPISPDIQELFAEYIGELPASIKIWQPEEAKQTGYTATEIHSPTPGRCFDIVGIRQRQSALAQELPMHLRGIAAQIISHPVMEALIVVDNQGHPEYLALSQGDRYCVWRRDTSQDS